MAKAIIQRKYYIILKHDNFSIIADDCSIQIIILR